MNRPAPDVWTVVAHDAGGAEVLSSHVKRRHLDCRFALAGPACAVFERKLGTYTNMTVPMAIQGGTRLLCATSWQSELELTAIRLAREAGLPSIAWVDHWTNYRERFSRAGRMCLPDEIWVGDPHALVLAHRCLPGLPVRLVENPYFADVKEELAVQVPLYGKSSGLRILYVCEPVREPALRLYGDELHFGYTEEQALRYFLDNVAALEQPVERIVIRLHPSEQADKYGDIAARYPLPIGFSEGDPLTAEVASVDCVVGCSSMAMVVGLLAGKRVVSCIPPGAAACLLPQAEIEHLRKLVLPESA